MRTHRNLGIVLFIAGVACLIIGGYINKQVADSRVEVSNTQTQLDTGDRVVTTKSRTSQVVVADDDTLQPGMDVGTVTVVQTDGTAYIFEVLGAILMIAGIGLIIYSYYDKYQDPHHYRDPRDPRDPRI